jgi:hypothetical protein
MINGFNIGSKPIGLTDKQMRYLEQAIRAVPPPQRETFMQKVAAHLSASPSDAALASAINAQMDLLTPKHFMCDSVSPKQSHTAKRTFSERYKFGVK